MTKEDIVSILAQPKSDLDPDREKLIQSIANQKEQLREELLQLEPNEIGGRIALAGFFYQFLVSIEYLIEMLDGKWDFVAVELHEDIIVGKDKQIKFVQVKSSQETHKNVSQTGLVTRSKKRVNRKDIYFNDSWVDKLLTKAKLFPKDSGYSTNFELVVSYVLINSRGLNVTEYTTNENFSLSVKDDDDLLVRLSETVYNKEDERVYDYKTECGEELKELLSRFYIKKASDMMRLDQYINHILFQFSERIGQGVRMSQEDLHFIVGILMDKCRLIGNNMVLYIDKEEAEEIRQRVHDRVIRVAGETTRRHDSLTVIETVFDILFQELQGIDIYNEIETEIRKYKQCLIDWVNNGGTVREIINRYTDGRSISTKYRDPNSHDQIVRLKELFSTCLLLILIHEDVIRISDKHKTLLVKEIKMQHLSFLSLNRGENVEKGIDKLKAIYSDIANAMDIILNPPNKVILQGSFTGKNGPVQTITIIDPQPQLEQVPVVQSLKEVPIILDVVPGGPLYEEYDRLFSAESLDDLRRQLQEYWFGQK